jgi:hypothetical protein
MMNHVLVTTHVPRCSLKIVERTVVQCQWAVREALQQQPASVSVLVAVPAPACATWLLVDNDDDDSSHPISSLPQAHHQLVHTAAVVWCCCFLPASVLHRTKVHALSSIVLAYAKLLVEEQLFLHRSNALVAELQLLEEPAVHFLLAQTGLPHLMFV